MAQYEAEGYRIEESINVILDGSRDYVSEKGREDLACLLLRRDVEVDLKDLHGRTPLSHAIMAGNTMVI
jgi:hypothetical protein